LVLVSWFVLVPSVGTFMQNVSARAEMLRWLYMLTDAPPEGSRLSDPAVVRQVERYVGARFNTQLTDPAFWNFPGLLPEQAGTRSRQTFARLRPKAEEVARLAQEVSPEELRGLETAPTAERAIVARDAGAVEEAEEPITLLVSMVFAWTLLAPVIVITLVMSVIVPGGLLTRTAGLAVVTGDGREISRGRSLWRALIAASLWRARRPHSSTSCRVRCWSETTTWPYWSTRSSLHATAAAGPCSSKARPGRERPP
jgi:hypothetical protein